MQEELKEVKNKMAWFEEEGNLEDSMKTNFTHELILFNKALDRLMLTCMAIKKSNMIE